MADVHAVARVLVGGDPADTWPLPVCWDAEQGKGDPTDDELWWLSVDQGAIDPDELATTTDRAGVTCRDCLEWLHA